MIKNIVSKICKIFFGNVLKKYYNGTYKFTTFQKNAAANCYYQVGRAQTGTC